MELAQKTMKVIREVPIEFKRIMEGHYPDFVISWKNTPLDQQVPVFMFHSVERSFFEAQLAFLKRNHYQTLTLKVFMAFLRGEYRLNDRSVLLTFDDGHKSWYETAYPLLKAYGFHAVGFLVSSFIRELPEQGQWLSWPEVREMEQSGVMTFESHTAYHDQIFVTPKLVDFYHPAYNHNALELDIPWVNEGERYTNRLRWGTPIYSHLSRFAGKPRFLDDIDVRQACVEWVERQGGETFFQEPNWRKALVNHFQIIASKQTFHQYQTKLEQREAILEGLVESKQTLEEKLNRPVQHLCYPWGVGSELAVALSQEAGYISNFWVANGQRNTNRRGDSPFYIPRLKDDYIFRLPGEGRKSLTEIFKMKLRRRAQKINIY